MLQIIKRSGNLEAFNLEKMKTALAATSDEVGQPLPASDLNNITNTLVQMLEGKETTTSQHLYIMLVGILYSRGMKEIADQYIGYKKNAWR